MLHPNLNRYTDLESKKIIGIFKEEPQTNGGEVTSGSQYVRNCHNYPRDGGPRKSDCVLV